MDIPTAQVAYERTIKARQGKAYQEKLQKMMEYLDSFLPWHLPVAVRNGDMSVSIVVSDIDLALDALNQSIGDQGYTFIPCREDGVPMVVVSWEQV